MRQKDADEIANRKEFDQAAPVAMKPIIWITRQLTRAIYIAKWIISHNSVRHL